MKLTSLILLTACLTASSRGLTQRVSISVKNASLETVFREIKKQTGYQFLYNNQMLDGAKKVSIQLKDAALDEALRTCFEGQPFTYEIVDRTIIIKPLEKKGEGHSGLDPESIPPIDITGKVTDADGNPLSGATVKVKGSNKGTTTGSDGVFVLKGVDDNATLEISYVGFETHTVILSRVEGKVGGGLGIIALKVKPENLNEVIVNKGYYTEKMRNTVGNVATIKAADIEKQPVNNPLLALQGRVPGLEITQLTGLNGGGVKVRIQGRNSISQGLDPLIIVDGVPVPNQLIGLDNVDDVVKGGSPLNYINPSDIESIDILKDADATAIYGSRAANGAILITTKKGKAGKAKITINLQQGWSKVSRHVDMLNTRQYLDMRYEAFRNSNTNWRLPSISADDLKVWDTTRYTDWQKVLIGGSANYTNINASVSGGTEAVQYIVGGTYNRRTTVFPGDFDDKSGTAHFSINSVSSNQRIRVQMSGNYTYDNNHLPLTDLTQRAILLAPDAPALYKSDGTLNWAPDAGGNSTWINPLAYTISSDYSNTTKNLVSNLALNYQIFKGLEIHSDLGYTSLTSELYQPTRLEYNKPELRPTSVRYALFSNRNMNTWIIEPQIHYNNKIGQGNIDAIVGTTIQKSSSDYLQVVGFGFSSDQLMKSVNAAPTTSASSVASVFRYNAAFGRLNYSLKEKYLFNFTARRDGSNRFGDNNKFSNFWSAGAAWIFSEEKFIEHNFSILSFGKVRMSYGVTGNDAIPDFSYLSIYDVFNGANPNVLPYQGIIGLGTSAIPNPYLKWEETRKWQMGIDLGFIKNRINLSATYARNRSSNQLTSYILPIMTGASSITKNLPATIQNANWEILLNTINIDYRDFTWSTSFNLTVPRNELISFPGIDRTPYVSGTNGIIVGKPLGVLKVGHFVGINPTNSTPLSTDKNGNPVPATSSYFNTLVSLDSKYYGGMINSFRFKGIQLEFLFDFVRRKGTRDMFWSNGLTYPGEFNTGVGASNQPITVLDRWQKSGDESLIPRFYTAPIVLIGSSFKPDAFYTYDASYVRFRNLTISWQLPSSLIQRTHLQNVKLYFRGQNIAVITKYRGMDPESGSAGMPPLRALTFGATISF